MNIIRVPTPIFSRPNLQVSTVVYYTCMRTEWGCNFVLTATILDIEEKQETTEDDTQLLITIDQSVNDAIKEVLV